MIASCSTRMAKAVAWSELAFTLKLLSSPLSLLVTSVVVTPLSSHAPRLSFQNIQRGFLARGNYDDNSHEVILKYGTRTSVLTIIEGVLAEYRTKALA